MKNTVVINIIGGPGIGKTTVASELFAMLKKLNYEVENVNEFAKELVWEGRDNTFKDRLYMHAEQNHRLMQMNGKLDFIITDSPLVLTSIYNDFYLKDQQTKEYNDMIHNVVETTWNYYNNKTYLIVRDTAYQSVGRRENEEEASIIDRKVREYLISHNIKYEVINVNEAAQIIYEEILYNKNY